MGEFLSTPINPQCHHQSPPVPTLTQFSLIWEDLLLFSSTSSLTSPCYRFNNSLTSKSSFHKPFMTPGTELSFLLHLSEKSMKSSSLNSISLFSPSSKSSPFAKSPAPSTKSNSKSKNPSITKENPSTLSNSSYLSETMLNLSGSS